MFKKLGIVLFAVFLIATAAFGLSACENDEAIESISFEGEIKSEYVRNEDVDLSGVSLKITYEDGRIETHPVTYEGVVITGDDTSVAKDNLTLTISYNGKSRSFTYSVRNPILTLEFGDGLWNEENSVTINAETNYTDVSSFVPEPNELGYEFAGWFYDEAFTVPVKYNFGENKINTFSDVTVYAGYDLSYSDKFEYEESSDGKITLTSLKFDWDSFGELYIPATVKLRPVVKIGDDFVGGFGGWISYNYLTFAENSSVTEIGDRAFFGLISVTEIKLPSTLKRIGEEAFGGINAVSIVIPASVESIGTSAFSSQVMLETVTFEEGSKLNFLGESVFSYCTALSSIELPEDLTVISPYAFNYCSNLERVYIGRNVKQIGLHAFASCSGLTSIDISEYNANYKSVGGNVYSKDGKTFVRYCFGINEEEFTLPYGVTSIYESAFDATGLNQMLKKINLPETLTNINDYAFKALDAEFVIPASVSYLSENALTSYEGDKFSISEDNPYFAVKDGVVYSSDFKTLISVPAAAEIEKFVLDPRTETISTGAFVDNRHVKFFIIPVNSSLKLIKEGAISLFKASNLGGLYIEKAEPFEAEENAFNEKKEYFASAVTIYVPESVKDEYIALFSDVVFIDNLPLSDLITSVSGAYTNVLERIKTKLNVTEAVNETEFAKIVDAYINDILSYSATPSFDIYSYFGDVYRMLDAAYYAAGEEGQSKNVVEGDFNAADLSLITIYEEKTIKALTDFYESANDSSFAHQKSFYKVKNHYLNLPEAVSEYLASTALRFDDIIERTDELIRTQNNIIKTANSIIANISEGFDVDLAAKIYADYEKYDTTLVTSRWSDIINISALKCSLLINEFLETPMIPGSLKTLDNLLYKHYDENLGYNALGITDYLNSGSYFKAQILRNKLYRYAEFASALADYEATGRERIVYETNEAVNNYDLTKFNHSEAFAVYENYSALTGEERNYDYWDKFVAIVLRININSFINIELNEETFDNASQIYLNIMADYSAKDLTCLPDEDDARLSARTKELFALFDERNAEFVAEIAKITADPSAADAEKFVSLFEAADDIGGYYPVTLTDPDGNKYETNASELYAMFVVISLKKEIAANFDDITLENYFEFDKYVNGYYYYDDNFIQIKVNGISYYAYFIKSVDCYNMYEKVVLTDEEVAKYNELIEKYNNFDFGETEW